MTAVGVARLDAGQHEAARERFSAATAVDERTRHHGNGDSCDGME